MNDIEDFSEIHTQPVSVPNLKKLVLIYQRYNSSPTIFTEGKGGYLHRFIICGRDASIQKYLTNKRYLVKNYYQYFNKI